MARSVVYVVQRLLIRKPSGKLEPMYKFEEAVKFGALSVVAEWEEGEYVSRGTKEFLQIAAKCIQEFDEERDFVLPVGSPVNVAAFYLGLASRGLLSASSLVWSRNSRQYKVEKIDLRPDLYSHFTPERVAS